MRCVARRSTVSVAPGEKWRDQENRSDDEEQQRDDFEEMYALCRCNWAVRHQKGQGRAVVRIGECGGRRGLAAAAEQGKKSSAGNYTVAAPQLRHAGASYPAFPAQLSHIDGRAVRLYPPRPGSHQP